MDINNYEKKYLYFATKQEWLEQRLKDITSTECSALFGLNPYISKNKLYILKKEKIIETLEDFYLKIGSILERSISKIFIAKTGKKINKKKEYISIPELKIGSSFDYEGLDEQGKFLLEIKNVSDFSFYENWEKEGDTVIKAPTHIEIQVQHQMLVSGIHRCYIFCLVGGNQVYIAERKHEEKITSKIIEKTKDFWSKIKNENEDLYLNSDEMLFIVNQCIANNFEETKTIIQTQEMRCILEKYKHICEKINVLKKSQNEIRNSIIEHSEGSAIILDEHDQKQCEVRYIKGRPGIIVTESMLGKTINATKGYFRILV